MYACSRSPADVPARGSAGRTDPVRLRYFASIREQLGCAEERLERPAGVDNVGDLLAWLGENQAERFGPILGRGRVLTAVNQDMADGSTPVADDDEVALFPPVTGG